MTTPLIVASRVGDLSKVKLLIAKGADLEAKDRDDWTALMIASKHGHLSIVQELIRSEANVDTKDKKNQTALFFAVQNGHLSIIKELVRNGAVVNVVNMYGDTPLIHAAVWRGCAFICIFLLLNGADATILRNGKNFLQWACWYKGNKVQFMKEMFCTEHVTEEMMNESLADKVARIHLAKRNRLTWMLVWKRKRNNVEWYAVTRDIARLIADRIVENALYDEKWDNLLKK